MGGYTGNELRFQELRVNLLFVIHVNRSRVESVGGEVFGRKVSSFEARLKIVEKSGRKIVKKSRWTNRFQLFFVPNDSANGLSPLLVYLYIYIYLYFINLSRVFEFKSRFKPL